MLVGQGRLKASLHQSLAGSGNRIDGGLQRAGDLVVTPALASLGGIGLQQDSSSHRLACTVFAATDQRVQLFALRSAELHDVLLYGNLFRSHDSSPVVPETSIQGITMKSMTEGTRATAIVLNEVYARGGQRYRFDDVTSHPVYQAAIGRGAALIWMPALIEEVARYCARDGGRFLELPRSKPFFAQALKNWHRAMAAEFSPITTWWP